ncbi:YugN family protein [Salmonella enterica]
MSASFNQFSEPEDPDAAVPDRYVATAKTLVKDLEERLLL